jgi:mono/diheme cytochrome c family protein
MTMRTWTLSIPVLAAAALSAFSPLVGCAASGGGDDLEGVAPGEQSGTSKGTEPGKTGGSTNPSSPGSSATNPGTKVGPGGNAWNASAPKGSVPVTGGTLLVLHDGVTAVAADPDRDNVSIISLASQKVLGQVQLAAGSEPGRVVADTAGIVHVVLRRGGGIADIDPKTATLLGYRQTCALPRGIVSRPSNDSLLVTCMTGEIYTLTADSSNKEPVSVVSVHTSSGPVVDLRDILVTANDTVFLTTFRSATVFQVADDGSVASSVPLNVRVDTSAAQLAANNLPGGTPQNFDPAVAWRAVLGPAGDIIIAHQGGTDRVIDVSAADQGTTQVPTSTQCEGSGTYGGETCTTISGAPICTPPIMIGLTSSVSPTGVVNDGPALPNGALPVDIAPTADGSHYIVALAGNPGGAIGSDGKPLLNIVTVPSISQGGPAANVAQNDSDLCALSLASSGVSVPGQVTAVAVDASGNTVAQTRQPASIQYVTASGVVAIPLSSIDVSNQGFDLFHTNTGRGDTCAGCHAEGQDDGRTWNFTEGFNADGSPAELRPRRTQTFRTGFLDTAPFHWDAEFAGMPALMVDVFVHRMAAADPPTPAQQSALELWMDGIPPKMHDVPSAALAASITRGQAIFQDSSTGCATCHSGKNFTNNLNEDIGFPGGVLLQTPSLIDVQFRGPFLHDGSVPTLEARFTDPTAMSGKHGTTSQLTPAAITDLVNYMKSL